MNPNMANKALPIQDLPGNCLLNIFERLPNRDLFTVGAIPCKPMRDMYRYVRTEREDNIRKTMGKITWTVSDLWQCQPNLGTLLEIKTTLNRAELILCVKFDNDYDEPRVNVYTKQIYRYNRTDKNGKVTQRVIPWKNRHTHHIDTDLPIDKPIPPYVPILLMDILPKLLGRGYTKHKPARDAIIWAVRTAIRHL